MADEITLDQLLAAAIADLPAAGVTFTMDEVTRSMMCETDLQNKTVFTKDDLDELDSCPVSKYTDSIDGSEDDAAFAKAAEEIDAAIAERDAEVENFQKNIEKCINEVKTLGEEMAAAMQSSIDKETTVARLQEIIDNIYPMYVYHSTKLEYSKDPTKAIVSYVSTDDLEDKRKAAIKSASSKYKLYSTAVEMDNSIMSMDLKIRNLLTLLIDKNIIGQTFLSGSTDGLTISNDAEDAKYSGLLYTNLYNQLEEEPIKDVNDFPVLKNFLTAEELAILNLNVVFNQGQNPEDTLNNSIYKGLELTPEQIQKNKELTDNVGNLLKQRIQERRQQIRDSIDSTDDSKLLGTMRYIAAIETKQGSGTGVSSLFVKRYEDIIKFIGDTSNESDKIKQENTQEKFLEKCNEVPCIKENKAKGGDETEIPPPDPTQEEMAASYQKDMDLTKPHPGKQCYWVRFAKLATQYGLLPFPDKDKPGQSLRYWPVGLLIPTPAKIIKIPLPMVWIPLVTISSAIGTLVIFIGQCGIFPQPYIFYISNDGSKSFILAITINPPSTSSDVFGFDGDLMKDFLKIPLPIIDLDGMNPLDAITFKALKDGEKFEDLLNEVKDNINRTIDKVGNPKMDRLNKIKLKLKKLDQNLSLTTEQLEEISNELRADLLQYVDEVKLPKIRVPKKNAGQGQLSIGLQMKDVMDMFKFMDIRMPGLELADLRFYIKQQITLLLDDMELKGDLIKLPNPMYLVNPDDVKAAKDYMKKLNKKIFKKLEESELLQMLSTLPPITINNPFKCLDDGLTVPALGPLIAFLQVALQTVEDILDGLDGVSLQNLLGMDTITADMLNNLFGTIIDKYVPVIPMPSKDFGKGFAQFIKDVTMNFVKFSFPKLTDIIKIDFGMALTIDFNDLIKPAIKEIINNQFDKIMQGLSITLKLVGDIANLAAIEFKVMLKNMISNSIDSICAPIKPAYDALSVLANLKIEANFMDMLNPLNAPKLIKKFKDALADALNSGLFIDARPLLLAALKALEKLNMLPFPAVGAVCAFGTFKPGPDGKNIHPIRLLHPLLYAEDLPPWERLTLKNFLFVVFLDEFCHQAKLHAFFPDYLP